MARVLIIDDDRSMCSLLSEKVQRVGHEADSANTLAEGLRQARANAYDVVFLDVMMPDGSGLDILEKVRKTPSEPEVIIITGLGSAEGAELAIKSGAWDYIEKGCSLKDMVLPLSRALQYREQKMGGGAPVALKREGIIGRSPKMAQAFDRLAQAAGSDASVMVTGETGTGKELFARAIHNNSARANSSFVVVDCAALPETLVESVLFGHERGSFTGADRAQEGLVKQADGGTLFLDEVGELPLALQKAFLRVLQEHRFRPVGAKQEVSSNFRLVAATNRDLEHMVEEGRFRSELLFRLRALTIHLPPLRERNEDLKDLAMYYISRICERRGMPTPGFTPDFLEALITYEWPGNVRELANTLEQAMTEAGDSPTLFRTHLPEHVRIALARSSVRGGGDVRDPAPPALAVAEPAGPRAVTFGDALPKLKDLLEEQMDMVESAYLTELMRRTGGDIAEACQTSGLSRTGLYNRLKKHGITRNGGRG